LSNNVTKDRRSTMAELIEALDALTTKVTQHTPVVSPTWGGADVIITTEAPIAETTPSFYPEVRVVVTDHAGELSWLFVQLRDLFADVLDSQNKIEFFGRLANAANRHLERNDTTTATSLCLAVTHEAYVIAEQVATTGGLDSLPAAFGTQVIDDSVTDGERTQPASAATVRAALRDLGVDL
jgi:hypothetical protein